MKRINLVALLLCGCVLFSGFSAQAGDVTRSVMNESLTENPGYLSEEEVFEALAFTYNDSELLKSINSQKTLTPNDLSIEGFHAEDYSEYTNNQYGGMYLNDNGDLVICYKNSSDALTRMDKLNTENLGRLISPSKKNHRRVCINKEC
jgi:hypothetical protein